MGGRREAERRREEEVKRGRERGGGIMESWQRKETGRSENERYSNHFFFGRKRAKVE